MKNFLGQYRGMIKALLGLCACIPGAVLFTVMASPFFEEITQSFLFVMLVLVTFQICCAILYLII